MSTLTENEKADVATFLETYLSIPPEKRGVVDGFVQGMAYQNNQSNKNQKSEKAKVKL